MKFKQIMSAVYLMLFFVYATVSLITKEHIPHYIYAIYMLGFANYFSNKGED